MKLVYFSSSLLIASKPFSSVAIELSAVKKEKVSQRSWQQRTEDREILEQAKPIIFPGEEKQSEGRTPPGAVKKRARFADEVGGKVSETYQGTKKPKDQRPKGTKKVQIGAPTAVKKTHFSTVALPEDKLVELLGYHKIDDPSLASKYTFQVEEKISADGDKYCEVGPDDGSGYFISLLLKGKGEPIGTKEVICRGGSHVKGNGEDVLHEDSQTGLIKVFKDPLAQDRFKDVNQYGKCTLTVDALSQKIVDIEDVGSRGSYYALDKALCNLYAEAAKNATSVRQETRV
ncbi:hypothetical protein FOL47_001686 [Perkinsus chesapeaki]|uniref:Uncharacterized protein n=1 Tax=Perkinsus chesapeaki TaxID=330153 RepID=A0A7J6MI26_PERCH|nr:hypothetical protein FOL47_001686 [Perkinsus chesapeaki]